MVNEVFESFLAKVKFLLSLLVKEASRILYCSSRLPRVARAGSKLPMKYQFLEIGRGKRGFSYHVVTQSDPAGRDSMLLMIKEQSSPQSPSGAFQGKMDSTLSSG